MKIKYRDHKFSADTLAVIDQMNDILAEYSGMVLTARQLYYQFVARDLVKNTQASYKRLTDILSSARVAGLVDWDMIEDRGRVPQTPGEWRDVKQIADIVVDAFRLPRWQGQRRYVELWVEKQALAGVLAPLAREFHVTMMVNKGYSSQSAMRDSALRYKANMRAYGSDEPVLKYLGDHDPSGKDMRRDIAERMAMFGVEDLRVDMIALTTAQVEEYEPPPNPAKITDPRAKQYIEEFGEESWELDALPPRELQRIIRESIEGEIDRKVWKKVRKEEDRQRDLYRRSILTLNLKKPHGEEDEDGDDDAEQEPSDEGDGDNE